MTCIDYLRNQDIITDLFCINKAQPQMMCKGKCYLKQQLEDKKEDSHQETTLEDRQVVQYVLAPSPKVEFQGLEPIPQSKTPNWEADTYHHLYCTDTYRPPWSSAA